MKRFASSFLILCMLLISAVAQTTPKGKIPPESKVFVSKMQNELDGFLTTDDSLDSSFSEMMRG